MCNEQSIGSVFLRCHTAERIVLIGATLSK